MNTPKNNKVLKKQNITYEVSCQEERWLKRLFIPLREIVAWLSSTKLLKKSILGRLSKVARCEEAKKVKVRGV